MDAGRVRHQHGPLAIGLEEAERVQLLAVAGLAEQLADPEGDEAGHVVGGRDPTGRLVAEQGGDLGQLALAAEAAAAAVEACAGRGYRVSAAVVDRSGVLKALLRADGAGPHTVSSARDKAYTAASLRAGTSQVLETVRTNPAAQRLPDIEGFLIVGGGLPICVGEEVVGAIGVGGRAEGQFRHAGNRFLIPRLLPPNGRHVHSWLLLLAGADRNARGWTRFAPALL